jgi:asparagine synthase (glutamine-hydrolysing)
MCGFVGIVQQVEQNYEQMQRNLRCMSDILAHRGPDGEGIWIDTEAGVGFGHRRLAVIDLSAAGHQPMISNSERYIISYNGEIYNFISIKKELDSAGSELSWRGHSDTEVILAAVEYWGIEKTLSKLVGMFAFSLWDKQQRILHLARDRMGEKPLYYGMNNKVFFFGSQLKAFTQHPDWQAEINRDALGLFMQYGYIPAPYSIYKNIFKLPPGTFLSIPVNTSESIANNIPEAKQYWSYLDSIVMSSDEEYRGDENGAMSELERILTRSITDQMVADVPLGAFLSGGIDSSLITALMQANSTTPVKTFSIGFKEKKYNEAQHASAVAKHLGTEHHELYLSPEDTLSMVPNIADVYDEPFADPSQIPTILLSQLARQHVTVSLSGDGGDELFCGYSRYFTDSRRWASINRLPYPARKVLSSLLLTTPYQVFNVLLYWTRLFRTPDGKKGSYASALIKLAEEMKFDHFGQFYDFRCSNWKHPTEIVLNSQPTDSMTRDLSMNSLNFSEQCRYMMSFDTQQYLPDDILVKVDRAAMSTSLETRVPLLDHRVIEFSNSLPLSMKVRNGDFKWLLKKLLYKYVPQSLVDRPKMGFGVPIGSWLRGPLTEWSQSMLNETRLKDEGYLNSALVSKKWRDHLSGRHNHQGSLWHVLMFQAWLEKNNP